MLKDHPRMPSALPRKFSILQIADGAHAH